MKRILSMMLSVMLFATSAHAGIQSDMTNFFNSMGASSNITPGGVYQSQAGGYATAGGVYARIPVRNYQLASITLPSIRAGCGGIDAYLGGFSFVNKTQFTAMLRNLGNNALGYAFQLALLVASPDIKSVLDKLQSVTQFINSTNTTSCHAAQALVDGIAGQLNESSGKLCAAQMVAKGQASDMQAAIEACKNPSTRKAGFSFASLTRPEKEKQAVSKNLMWDAIKKTNYAGAPTIVKEMLMSLTGTFINTIDNGGTAKARWNPPTGITVADLINGTTNMKVLSCGADTSNCMPPGGSDVLQKRTVTVAGFKVQARAALEDLRNALENERINQISAWNSLKPDTRKLILTAHQPVLKMLNTAVAIGPQLAMEIENEMVAPVAFSIVAEYLNQAYRMANQAAHGGVANVNKTEAMALERFAAEAKKAFVNLEEHQKVITAMQVLQQAKFLDQVLVANMSPHFREVLAFGRGK